MAAPLNLTSMYSPGSFLAMWKLVYEKCILKDIVRFWSERLQDKAKRIYLASYSLALIGLKAVHVVGASDAPGAQELQQVDFHRSLHEDKIVVRHTKAEIEENRTKELKTLCNGTY